MLFESKQHRVETEKCYKSLTTDKKTSLAYVKLAKENIDATASMPNTFTITFHFET